MAKIGREQNDTYPVVTPVVFFRAASPFSILHPCAYPSNNRLVWSDCLHKMSSQVTKDLQLLMQLRAFIDTHANPGENAVQQNKETWESLATHRVFNLTELKAISEDADLFQTVIPWLGTRNRLYLALHPGQSIPSESKMKDEPDPVVPHREQRSNVLQTEVARVTNLLHAECVKSAKLTARLHQECVKSAKLARELERQKVVEKYQKLESLPNSWCNPFGWAASVSAVGVKHAVVHAPCPDGASCRFLLSQYDPKIAFYGYDHNKPWTVESAEFKALVAASKDQIVGLFDVTLTPALLRALAKTAKFVFGRWDHHPTVVQMLLSDPVAPDNVHIKLDLSETKCGALLTCEWLHTVSDSVVFRPDQSWLRLINLHDTGQFDLLSSADETLRVGLTAALMKDVACLNDVIGAKRNETLVEMTIVGRRLQQQQEAVIQTALKGMEIRVLDTTAAIQRFMAKKAADAKDAKDTKDVSKSLPVFVPQTITIAYVDVPDFATPTMIRDRIPEVDVVASRTPASTPEQTAISLRAPTISSANVGDLAQLYGGGGHTGAAACKVVGRYLY